MSNILLVEFLRTTYNKTGHILGEQNQQLSAQERYSVWWGHNSSAVELRQNDGSETADEEKVVWNILSEGIEYWMFVMGVWKI